MHLSRLWPLLPTVVYSGVMQQEERSERSRTALLDAALALFSSQGYRATSVRDIAERAGTSTGSVYHHFRDKEAIFQTLLDHFWQASSSPDFPLTRVFEEGAFPGDLPAIGRAAQAMVLTWRPYIALIYVDVVEFEGATSTVSTRTWRPVTKSSSAAVRTCGIGERVREGIPASRRDGAHHPHLHLLLHRRDLFGVPNHYGLNSEDAMRLIADILTKGMVKS